MIKSFMKKKILIVPLLVVTIMCFLSSYVNAEDIIRYTMTHELEIQKASFVPSNEEMQEWFNIDLPRDENGILLYTLEFDISEVDFTKKGEYPVVLTFYKRADHKYQKTFNLNIVEPEEEGKPLIGEIEIRYLKQVGAVFGVGLVAYVVILFFLNSTSKRKRYVIIYDNKILKTLKSREALELEKIQKRLKLKDISSCIIMNKEDIPQYVEEMTKKIKKYDFVALLKK